MPTTSPLVPQVGVPVASVTRREPVVVLVRFRKGAAVEVVVPPPDFTNETVPKGLSTMAELIKAVVFA